MHIGKLKTKWNIRCKLINLERKYGRKYFPLSFTLNDYLVFTPPDGVLKDFHLYGDLHSSYPKVKPGIYRNSHACVLIRENSQGKYLQGFSHNINKLQEFTAKILSSAGIEPVLFYDNPESAHDFMTDWTDALLLLQKD
jgi:hypothetical protein